MKKKKNDSNHYSEVLEFCREKGIPDITALLSSYEITKTYSFAAWRLRRSWVSLANAWKDETAVFLTWFVHGKRGW